MLKSPKFSSCPGKHQKNLPKLILANRKLKCCEITEELKISESSVFTILREHLSMRKLCWKWVLFLFSWSKTMHWPFSVVYNCFNATKRSFCINMWQWMKPGSNTSLWGQIDSQLSGPQQVKAVQSNQTQTSAGKVLSSVFWDVQGILFIDYLEKGRTINSEYYIALLMHLKEEVTKKWPQMKEKVLSPCHKSIATIAKLHDQHFELLPHPPYCVTTGSLETSKECSWERDLAPMKWYWKLRCILKSKTNHSTNHSSNY